MNISLQNQRSLVTGGTRGIGRQIVLDLGELIKVVLTPEEHETVLGILERKTGLNPD